jgi:hypothetical protein
MKKAGVSLAIFFMAALLLLYGFNFFRSYYFSIPIELVNTYQIPCTSVEIEGKKYSVEIDLGSKTALSLHKKVLDKIKKNPCGSSRRVDFLGNTYETPLYLISNVKIGSLLLRKINTKEESLGFTAKNSLLIPAKETQDGGRLGRDFFSDKNIFMDFGHRVFLICRNLKDIEREGYKTTKLAAVPFKNTTDGIILEIETDLGLMKFVLDTGTTASAIRNTQKTPTEEMLVIETLKFSMNKIDFGPQKLYLLNISPEFEEIDGFLGMDFWNGHAVYLDFAKNIAYIGKTSSIDTNL